MSRVASQTARRKGETPLKSRASGKDTGSPRPYRRSRLARPLSSASGASLLAPRARTSPSAPSRDVWGRVVARRPAGDITTPIQPNSVSKMWNLMAPPLSPEQDPQQELGPQPPPDSPHPLALLAVRRLASDAGASVGRGQEVPTPHVRQPLLQVGGAPP